MKNYIQNLRSKIGQDKFIHPAARIIVENEKGQILIIERVDNGKMGLPAGGLEEGETIEECIIREVKEETGLVLLEVKVIGISSNPERESVLYPNGDQIQYFTIEFYSNNWEGAIGVIDTAEVKTAKFVKKSDLKYLPANEGAALESLQYWKKTGKVMLK